MAFTVTPPLKAEALLAKVTVPPALIVTAPLLVELALVIPSTVTSPVSPVVFSDRLVAVIWPSSASSSVNCPAVPPNPIERLVDAVMLVAAAPPLRVPTRSTSAAVMLTAPVLTAEPASFWL